MNNVEAIVHLGAQQGAALRPVQDVADLQQRVPYFRLRKAPEHRSGYAIDAFNYEHHDNAGRMAFLTAWLQHAVLPFVEGGVGDLSGYYNVELHDSYSYLNNDVDYSNCLTWSKHKNDHGPVLLPDVYQIAGYQGRLDATKDNVPWEVKADKVAFYGTTTGSRDAAANERLRVCKWRAATPGADAACDFFITQVAQMSEADIVAAYGQAAWARMQHPYVPPHKLFEYKFCLDVPGNTCSWDRVPLVLSSRSLLFKLRCQDMCWYYPLLRGGTHYVGIDGGVEEVLKQRAYFLINAREHEFISTCANRFVKDHLSAQHAQLYAVALFNACAFHRGR